MAPTSLDKNTDIRFRGSNWEDLDRLVGLARFQFIQDSDYDDEPRKQCASLAMCFEGPALDWVTKTLGLDAGLFQDFDDFVLRIRQAFGVADNNIEALCRRKLDELQWGRDVPVFFAEFDRLTSALNIAGHGTKIAMVEAKLPSSIKQLFAEQALSFANYETMRERLNTMWALSPTQAVQKKPRCGSCGKKGHTTQTCKSGSSKN